MVPLQIPVFETVPSCELTVRVTLTTGLYYVVTLPLIIFGSLKHFSVGARRAELRNELRSKDEAFAKNGRMSNESTILEAKPMHYSY